MVQILHSVVVVFSNFVSKQLHWVVEKGCFRGSEGHLSELVHTREVISPYPFESFGRQLQQLSRARGLRDNSTLH